MVFKVLTTYKINLVVSLFIVVYIAMLWVMWLADNCTGLGFNDRPDIWDLL